jgi:sugar phosphate isomerase/epimerase
MARLGMQLIVYRGREREDLAGVLKAVKGAGYDGVEAGNLSTLMPLEQVRALFQEHGLALTGVHSGYGDFKEPAKLEANLRFLTAMGGRYLMCSGVEDANTREGYEKSAEVFNRAGRVARDAGAVLCYHNHNWEFKPFDGKLAIDLLAERTDPDLVKLNIDLFWVAVGGEDPAAFVRRYAGRCPYFHVKDGEWEPGHPGKATKFCELGRGKVDLRSAVGAALATNPDWLIYEQDTSYDKDPTQASTESLQYLKQIAGR